MDPAWNPYTDFDLNALDPATRQQMLTFLLADPASQARAMEVLSPSVQSLTVSPSLVSPDCWTNQPGPLGYDNTFDETMAYWGPTQLESGAQSMQDVAVAGNDWTDIGLEGDFG